MYRFHLLQRTIKDFQGSSSASLSKDRRMLVGFVLADPVFLIGHTIIPFIIALVLVVYQ